jgi:23S rRNA pseudouridine1911/1915/1917 synthase
MELMRIPIDEAAAGTRLDKLLVLKVPGLGRAGAKRLFDEGRVRIVTEEPGRGRRVTKGDVAQAGDVLDVDLDPQASTGAAPDPDVPLEVLLELPHLLVLDKPAGQPTAPIAPGERGTLANALIARYPELAGIGFSAREPGLVHRLDTETSGLVLAARTAEAFEVLSTALKEGRLDKRYLLLCDAHDLPEQGTIAIPIAPHPKDRRRVYPCVHPRDVVRYGPRPAVTTYRVTSVHGPWALVEARAAKASRHQIRAHFAAIEHPLAGDTLYGGPAIAGLTRHALHAHHLAWSGDPKVPAFCVQSPLPPDMAALVSSE